MLLVLWVYQKAMRAARPLFPPGVVDLARGGAMRLLHGPTAVETKKK